MKNKARELPRDFTADERNAANALLRSRNWNAGIGQPLGPLPPSNWGPEEFVYYRIGIDASSVGSSHILKFTYDYCGWVQATATMNGIGTFLKKLQDNYTNPNAFLTQFTERPTLNPPTIRLIKPCYVIFHLKEDWNWQFAPAVEGMRTRDSLPDKYRGLVHVDRNWSSAAGTADPIAPTNIVYFSTLAIEPMSADRTDPFNLFVVFTNGTKASPITIDPDIKNDGGDTHGLMRGRRGR